MKRAMRYGRGSVVVDLPAQGFRGVVEPTMPPAIRDVRDVVWRCLDEPVGGKPLAAVLEGRRDIALVIPDATRNAAVREWLPPLLGYIARAGVEAGRLCIVIATGKHRPPTQREMQSLVGTDLYADWNVVAHDADRGNVELGALDDETPVAVNARVAEADCVILAGSVTYHYTAGFGGGRKLIAPGVCARETVDALHRRTLANIDQHTGEWRSRSGALRDNPFHAALLATAEKVAPAFALNILVGPQGRIIGLVAGDPVQSHTVACLRYDQLFRVGIAERLPLVVASCGGSPYDVNLYQAHKALDNAFRAVRSDGTIVLLAECAEGWGPQSFVEWLAIETLEEHRARLEDRFEIAGHTTYALKWKASRCRVIVASGPLAKRLERGDGPSWLAAGGRDSPFCLEIASNVEEAFQRAAIADGTAYYLMPVATACLPEGAG